MKKLIIWGMVLTALASNALGALDSADGGVLAVTICLPMVLGFMLLVGAVTLSGEEHPVMKIFLFLLSLATYIMSSHLALTTIIKFYSFTEIQDPLTTYIYIFSWCYFVIITYFIIYALVKMFHYIGEKREERLEY